MANSNIKLWVGVNDGLLYKEYGTNTPADTLVFIQGDTVAIDLHLVGKVGQNFSGMEEVPFPAGSILRMAIGLVDEAPTAGSYQITYDGDTATMAFDATASQIQAALNALPSIVASGGVSVSSIANTIIQVNFLTPGVNSAFLLDATALAPTSSTKVVTLRAGSVSVAGAYLFKIRQSPVVWEDTWTDIPAPTVSVTELIANRTKRLTIDPPPKTGTLSITGTDVIYPKVYTDGNESNLSDYWDANLTWRFSVDAPEEDFYYANATDVPAAYRGQPYFQYDVNKVSEYTWDFTLKTNYTVPSGYAMPLSATSDGLVGYSGKTAVVSFDTAELEYLMNGEATVQALLEIELETGSAKRTLVQTIVTIRNNIIDQPSFSPITFESPVTEAPVDGNQYVRTNGGWTQIQIDGGTY